MNSTISLLIFLAGLIFASPFLARMLRLPVLAVEILLGSLFASAGLIADSEFYALAAHIGFCFLMFLAGLEVSLRDFFALTRSQLGKIAVFYVILYAFSSLAAAIFGLGLIFVVLIPAMSVGLIAILYKDLSAANEWLDRAMITAALGEVVTILLTTVLNSFAQGAAPVASVLALAAFLAAFLLLFYLIRCLFWWFPQLKSALMPATSKAEQGVRSALAVLIIAAALVLFFGFELALGAFLAGVFIASFFEHAQELEERLCALGYGVLVPVFFSHVGLGLDLFALNFAVLKTAALIAVLMLAFRLIASLVFAQEMGAKCLLVGLSTSMPLTLLIAIATLGARLGLLDGEAFAAIVLAALAQAVAYMWLIPRAALLFETRGK